MVQISAAVEFVAANFILTPLNFLSTCEKNLSSNISPGPFQRAGFFYFFIFLLFFFEPTNTTLLQVATCCILSE